LKGYGVAGPTVRELKSGSSKSGKGGSKSGKKSGSSKGGSDADGYRMIHPECPGSCLGIESDQLSMIHCDLDGNSDIWLKLEQGDLFKLYHTEMGMCISNPPDCFESSIDEPTQGGDPSTLVDCDSASAALFTTGLDPENPHHIFNSDCWFFGKTSVIFSDFSDCSGNDLQWTPQMDSGGQMSPAHNDWIFVHVSGEEGLMFQDTAMDDASGSAKGSAKGAYSYDAAASGDGAMSKGGKGSAKGSKGGYSEDYDGTVSGDGSMSKSGKKSGSKSGSKKSSGSKSGSKKGSGSKSGSKKSGKGTSSMDADGSYDMGASGDMGSKSGVGSSKGAKGSAKGGSGASASMDAPPASAKGGSTASQDRNDDGDGSEAVVDVGTDTEEAQDEEEELPIADEAVEEEEEEEIVVEEEEDEEEQPPVVEITSTSTSYAPMNTGRSSMVFYDINDGQH
jgi:hypothetical protein